MESISLSQSHWVSHQPIGVNTMSAAYGFTFLGSTLGDPHRLASKIGHDTRIYKTLSCSTVNTSFVQDGDEFRANQPCQGFLRLRAAGASPQNLTQRSKARARKLTISTTRPLCLVRLFVWRKAHCQVLAAYFACFGPSLSCTESLRVFAFFKNRVRPYSSNLVFHGLRSYFLYGSRLSPQS